MDKRLAKRHARQVARKRASVKGSEPDVRTQEEIEAAREASRSENIRGADVTVARNSSRSLGKSAATTGSAAKTSV